MVKVKRKYVLWGVAALAVVAFPVGVMLFRTGGTDYGASKQPVVEQTNKTTTVDDGGQSCYELTHFTMQERIATPANYSQIMPLVVPEEHFAPDAWRIATTVGTEYTKAHKLAVAYDADVAGRCGQ